MERYIFSGALTQEMHDLLLAMSDFEPLDILESQLNRSSINKFIEWKKEGFCQWLFIDSGAFSIHTGNAKMPGWKSKETPTFRDWEDNYIEFLNSIDEYVDVFAQLDTIPGKFRQDKTPEDYIESAQKSWDNYLYMRERVKSPQKLMPVFHHGESVEVLKKMLDWRDENGKPLEWLGLSPANDRPQKDKDLYLTNMTDIIAKSSNPNVKTHLYGMTALPALAKYPCYSADSVSHRLISGFAKIMSQNFGVISISKNERQAKCKSNMSFIETCDDHNMELLQEELKDANLTLEQVQESVSARVAFTMHSMQKLVKTKYKYNPTVVKKAKKLF